MKKSIEVTSFLFFISKEKSEASATTTKINPPGKKKKKYAQNLKNKMIKILTSLSSQHKKITFLIKNPA